MHDVRPETANARDEQIKSDDDMDQPGKQENQQAGHQNRKYDERFHRRRQFLNLAHRPRALTANFLSHKALTIEGVPNRHLA